MLLFFVIRYELCNVSIVSVFVFVMKLNFVKICLAFIFAENGLLIILQHILYKTKIIPDKFRKKFTGIIYFKNMFISPYHFIFLYKTQITCASLHVTPIYASAYYIVRILTVYSD